MAEATCSAVATEGRVARRTGPTMAAACSERNAPSMLVITPLGTTALARSRPRGPVAALWRGRCLSPHR